jgi:thiamine monophosphate synthase
MLGEVGDEELEAVHRVVAPLAGHGLHLPDGDAEVDEVNAVHDPRVVESVTRDRLEVLALLVARDDAIEDEAFAMRAVVIAVDFIHGALEATVAPIEPVVGLPLLPLGGLHLGNDRAVLVAAVDAVADVDDLAERQDLAAAERGRKLRAWETVELIDQRGGRRARNRL